MKKKEFLSLMLEKGQRTIKDKIKYYTPELMLKKKKTGAKYEIAEIDLADADNPVISIFRWDPDGTRKETSAYTVEELYKDFEIARGW